mgnify:FL=1
MVWKIEYYKTADGKSPVESFIEDLDLKPRSKVYYVLNLLEEFGIRVGHPHTKKLAQTNIWELRTLGQNNIRILYITFVGKKFLLLHGFWKKKQKTDTREIKIAEVRLKDYKSRFK